MVYFENILVVLEIVSKYANMMKKAFVNDDIPEARGYYEAINDVANLLLLKNYERLAINLIRRDR
jgi:hypothetical protein